MNTPLLPGFRPKLSAMGCRTITAVKNASLPSLHHALDHLVPSYLLADEDEGVNSRQRVFFMRRTFWCFLWQTLSSQRACRDVVLQVKAMRELDSESVISSDTGAYVTARQRLPLERLESIFEKLADTAASKAGSIQGAHGRRVMAVDATFIQLADTPELQKRYPQPPLQKRNCGFPIMKISALFNLASGAIHNVETANRKVHELPLLFRLFSNLRRGDIWLGDALYSAYAILAHSVINGVDAIVRMEGSRLISFRNGRKIGLNERLITWTKPAYKQPRYLTKRQWKAIPETIQLRLIRVKLHRKGWRPLEFFVVTTLMDQKAYPADWIAELYLRRWRLEICFRDLKTSLGMEALRTKSSAMAQKEMMMFLVAHNMIRCMIAEAARAHEKTIDTISFIGTVAVIRQYCHALAEASNRRKRKNLFRAILSAIAEEVLPFRPNRIEPRAVKKRPKGFARLVISRKSFRARNAKKYSPVLSSAQLYGR